MSKEETTSKQSDEPEVSKAKTILWLAIGLLIYGCIQWMLPKVGLNS